MMRKLLKISLINLLVLLALLSCLEIILRLKGDTYTWTEKGNNTYTWTQKGNNTYVDPWEENNLASIHTRPPGKTVENYPEFIYELDVNEDGVRDISHSVMKPENTIRILGLGDSFMEGMGADFDSTIMSFLKTKLYALGIENNVETMAAGVAGSDVFRSFNLLEEKLIRYNPDWVIILVNNTDVNDWLIKGNELGIRPAIATPPFIKRTLFKHFHLYRTVSINVFGHSWLQQSPKNQKQAWGLFKKDFEQLILKYVNLLGKKEKVLFVFHPLVHELSEGKYFYPFAELETILNENQISSIDALKCLQEKNANPNQIYWSQDMHFKPVGYSLISDCIIESNLLTH